ncbi:MAG TPA: homoserine O-succinyltransferase [Gemmatimonadaceae bacterium]|jgi:homoserine O-succinyltransferase
MIESFPGITDRLAEPQGARVQLTIGLVNNMPDPALESTERQFRELLSIAGEAYDLRLRLFSFPEVMRDEAARAYVAEHYDPIDDLWSGTCDGLVVTGAEPRTPSLPNETYWPPLARLVDWASETATPTVWSCLAAHGAVLHLDGIERQPVGEKISGVFRCRIVADTTITAQLPSSWQVPHSRLNTLDPRRLTEAGYEILSISEEAGVDMFQLRRHTLFLFLQGHPEYDGGALFREYRRDVGRFLAGTRSQYPEMPRSYFDADTAHVLEHFRARAERRRTPEWLVEFPACDSSLTSRRPWGDVAVSLYKNWLAAVEGERTATSLGNGGSASIRAGRFT